MTVRIGRILATVLVSADHPDPNRLHADVNTSLTAGLRDGLAALLPTAIADSGDAVWMIRRLEIEADVNAHDHESVARAIAASVAQSLGRAMAGNGDGVDVVRFRHRPELLARYIAATANGSRDRWYFGGFEGLTRLSPSAAIRTALLRDPAAGWTGLAELSPAEATQLAAVLTRGDVELLLSAFAGLGGDGRGEEAVEAVIAQHAVHAQLGGSPWRLFLACRDRVPPSRALLAAVAAIADLTALERLSSAIRAAVAAGDARALSELAPDARALVSLVPKLKHRPDLLARLADADDAPPVETPAGESTSFGGAFLLLPDLDAHVDNLTADERLFTLACALSASPGRTMRDPLLRRLLLPAVPGADAGNLEVSADRRQACVDRSVAVLASFASHLPGFERSTAAHLRTIFLDTRATLAEEPDRIVVHVARPPLALMLDITGLLRRQYQIPWIDARPFHIFAEP